LEEKTWETVKENPPTARKLTYTHGKFDDGNIATMDWEIMNHPPYCHDLVPSVFHLF
jgi:hypothetical protein